MTRRRLELISFSLAARSPFLDPLRELDLLGPGQERVLHRGADEELKAVRGRLGGRVIPRPTLVGTLLCSFVVVLAALAARLAAGRRSASATRHVLPFLVLVASLPGCLCRAFWSEPPPRVGLLTLQKV